MKANPVRKSSTTATKTPVRRTARRAMPLADLQARAGDAAALLKALANPDRLLLLCHLVEAERAVGELGEMTGIAQPSLSQQLGVLRTEGLVATRREGKSIVYRIASPAVHAVLRTLYDLFCNDSL
jgi:ArsR family transcriptional regulator